MQSRKNWAIAGIIAASLISGGRVFAAPDDPKPEAKQDTKQDAKPAPKPDAKPEAKAEAKPEAKPDPGGKYSVAGSVDWYYLKSLNNPATTAPINGRAFDVKNDQFSFALLKVDVTRTPGKDVPVGFTATFSLGKTADIVHATEPGGVNTYRYLTQLYGTYVTPGSKPLTIDFGKFVTAMGYEVIGSSANDNYSGSLLFTYAIPFYHAGLRFSYPLTPTLTGQIHIVNGWNNVEDDNGGKSIGAQLAWNPNAKWSWILNWMGGDEGSTTVNGAGTFGGIGFPAAGVLNVQMVDLVGVWKPTAKLKLGLNLDYGDAGKPGVAGGHWSGEAVYGRYQLSGANAIALRAEHFEDRNGLRTGISQNVNEITATLEHAWKNYVIRLEFRHDHAGSPFFFSGGGAGPSNRDQDTLTLGNVFKF